MGLQTSGILAQHFSYFVCGMCTFDSSKPPFFLSVKLLVLYALGSFYTAEK